MFKRSDVLLALCSALRWRRLPTCQKSSLVSRFDLRRHVWGNIHREPRVSLF
jgi:hypothetical protein